MVLMSTGYVIPMLIYTAFAIIGFRNRIPNHPLS